MSDLIDRKQAIFAVCSVCSAVRPEYRGEKCIHFADGCEEVERLNELPSAQPEPVTRCKDCVYNKGTAYCYCLIFNGMYGRTLDNYCSRAERKEE